MRVSLDWLREYIDFDVSGAELARRLTESLAETEFLGVLGADVAGIAAAKVVTVEPHPDADTLSVCVVDCGERSATVVCGAPNVRPGMMAVLAGPGATIAGGRSISEQTIRGRRSHGMLVSAAELGLEEASEGIIELPAATAPGSDVRAILGLDGEIIDVDVQPNRPDCLGMIGVAREVAAILGGELRLPEFTLREDGDAVGELATVAIEDRDGCPRYIARVITGLTIGPSPLWLQTRLRSVGLRSICNVVDATNFVMLERGHPIHAFDCDTLSGHRIVVRRAEEGEILVTLDGGEHSLSRGHLLICDGARPIALAGVMGGAETEVTAATCNVLLECACFDPVVVRRGAASLGLRTESSVRFERGIDAKAMSWVAERACALVAELGGGTVARGSVDAGSPGEAAGRISLRLDRVRSMLIRDLAGETIAGHLKRLGFDVEPADGSGEVLDVGVPSHRRDVEVEADLIEEVARVHGYDKVEAEVPFHSASAPSDRAPVARSAVCEAMVGLGFYEIVTSSFMTAGATGMLGAGHSAGERLCCRTRSTKRRRSCEPPRCLAFWK